MIRMRYDVQYEMRHEVQGGARDAVRGEVRGATSGAVRDAFQGRVKPGVYQVYTKPGIYDAQQYTTEAAATATIWMVHETLEMAVVLRVT